VGIADPIAEGGAEPADGAQTSEASDAPGVSDAFDASDGAPQDAPGDPSVAPDGVDGPVETATDAPADVTTQDAPPLTQYVVFATSQPGFTGNLGGLTGADQKCQARAAAANPPLTGTFKAWLSDSTASAASRVAPMHGMLPYVMVDMTVVASDWAALTDPSGTLLQHMITRDENGNTVPNADSTCMDCSTTPCTVYSGHYVWTDSNDDGSLYDAGQSCQSWASASNADNGSTGSASTMQATQYWSSWCHVQSCDSLASLYCIQQ
jgi:hypothetical protein